MRFLKSISTEELIQLREKLYEEFSRSRGSKGARLAFDRFVAADAEYHERERNKEEKGFTTEGATKETRRNP